ncbi:hypothetical protein [Desulfurivibrio dismutans]|uniref:hypothetical protein n=1 Tax=Desulfurivibrio dismutans TaxID=1398908 RepID=UPI0023DA7597|nr:hypothetical protein [Desulfurivibrio alkaliphilus]MDF1613643.1 hypothetical protein [Desulfurivibrio alkaliphilus]
MHKITSSTIDLSKVRAVVYHLPDGDSFAIPIENFEQFFELGVGKVCDTSEVDGFVHFFPRGNA